MRYFIDTEFIEDGTTIDLISIGIVAEDGREFYACSMEAKLHLASPWVRKNVLAKLPSYESPLWISRAAIKLGIQRFVSVRGEGGNEYFFDHSPGEAYGGGRRVPDPAPEFWAYFADYDWVTFCQLFGRMLDLPENFPKFCMDLKQWAVQLGVSKDTEGWPIQKFGEHNALMDAHYDKAIWEFLHVRAEERHCGGCPT